MHLEAPPHNVGASGKTVGFLSGQKPSDSVVTSVCLKGQACLQVLIVKLPGNTPFSTFYFQAGIVVSMEGPQPHGTQMAGAEPEGWLC